MSHLTTRKEKRKSERKVESRAEESEHQEMLRLLSQLLDTSEEEDGTTSKVERTKSAGRSIPVTYKQAEGKMEKKPAFHDKVKDPRKASHHSRKETKSRTSLVPTDPVKPTKSETAADSEKLRTKSLVKKVERAFARRAAFCPPTPKVHGLRRWIQRNLLASTERFGAPVDATLVNPWGVAIRPDYIAVAVNGGEGPSAQPPNIRRLNEEGKEVGSPILLEGDQRPTGIVANFSSTSFRVGFRAADLITVTIEGTVQAWQPDLGGTAEIVATGPDGASFFGVTILETRRTRVLAVADFGTGVVRIYGSQSDNNFQELLTLTDPDAASAGYFPFNVAAIDGKLYVAYALKEEDEEVTGPGLGRIVVFRDPLNTTNPRPRTLVFDVSVDPDSRLNAPWAMIAVPRSVVFRNSSTWVEDEEDICKKDKKSRRRSDTVLLVGEFGNGRIDIFDIRSGEWLGQLIRPDGSPVIIGGLWGLASRQRRGSTRFSIFFAAGPADETEGLFGVLQTRVSSSTPRELAKPKEE